MSGVTTPTEIDSAQLPAAYDELIPIEQLVHGKHNPRRVRPTDVLRESVAQEGLDRPLIVWWDADREVYQITDGWQRYQAATEAGWEQLPVKICESPLDALQATETASIVRQWSKYEWAQYYKSLDEELRRRASRGLEARVHPHGLRWQSPFSTDSTPVSGCVVAP